MQLIIFIMGATSCMSFLMWLRAKGSGYYAFFQKLAYVCGPLFFVAGSLCYLLFTISYGLFFNWWSLLYCFFISLLVWFCFWVRKKHPDEKLLDLLHKLPYLHGFLVEVIMFPNAILVMILAGAQAVTYDFEIIQWF